MARGRRRSRGGLWQVRRGYEQYIMRDKDLYKALRVLLKQHKRGLAASGDAGHSTATSARTQPPSGSVGAGTSAHDGSSDVSASTRDGSNSGLTQDVQTRRLTRQLLRTFERGGVNVGDGLTHLVCLQDTDSRWEDVQGLAPRERAAVDALAAVLGNNPRLATILSLRDVPPPAATQAAHPGIAHDGAAMIGDSTTSGGSYVDDASSPAPTSAGSSPSLSAGSSTVAAQAAPAGTSSVIHSSSSSSSSDGSVNNSTSDVWWSNDMALSRLVQRGVALGLEEGAILLSSATLKALLRHPHAPLRRAVYQHGLVPRHQRALKQLHNLAAVRAEIAESHSSESFAHHVQASLACGSPPGAVTFLQELAEVVRVAADAQVVSLAAAMEYGSAQQLLQPWDLEAARQALQARRGVPPAPSAEELAPYLQLPAVLRGVSRLLRWWMGVELRLVSTPCGADGLQRGGSEAGPDAELWDPNVLKLELSCESPDGASLQPIGTLYIEPGGAYGTRQLRYGGCGGGTAGTTAVTGGVPPAVLPAVAIGLNSCWQGDLASGVTQASRAGLAGPAPGAGCGSPAALVELLHEVGHALHLLLSSTRTSTAFLGGLNLPIELLEVPSTVMEGTLLNPAMLQVICQRAHQEDDCEVGRASSMMPEDLAKRLAHHIHATHFDVLSFQEQVLTSLADQLLHLHGPSRQPDDLWRAVWDSHSSLAAPSTRVPLITMRQIEILPVVAHHRATFYAYAFAFVVACHVWDGLELQPPQCPTIATSSQASPTTAVAQQREPHNIAVAGRESSLVSASPSFVGSSESPTLLRTPLDAHINCHHAVALHGQSVDAATPSSSCRHPELPSASCPPAVAATAVAAAAAAWSQEGWTAIDLADTSCAAATAGRRLRQALYEAGAAQSAPEILRQLPGKLAWRKRTGSSVTLSVGAAVPRWLSRNC